MGSTDFRVLTTDKLREIVAQTRTTLSELEAELERRDELRQHHEIANLDTHMRSAELSLTTLRNFIAYLAEDLKSRRK